MKLRALYLEIKKMASEGKTEEMFSHRELWLALCEKYTLSPDSFLVSPDLDFLRSDMMLADAKRLIEGYPIGYYLGHTEFFGLDFLSRENVLIPRADSEILVNAALGHSSDGMKILDICSGSGIIGLSILSCLPSSRLLALDISPDAIELTRENAKRLSLIDRSEIKKADIMSKESEKAIFDFAPDIIVSNPPYIRTRDLDYLPPNVQNEPRLALDGGESGVIFYERITSLCIPLIEKGSLLFFEIGYDERNELCEIASMNNLAIEIIPDLSGLDRVAFLRKKTRN